MVVEEETVEDQEGAPVLVVAVVIVKKIRARTRSPTAPSPSSG